MNKVLVPLLLLLLAAIGILIRVKGVGAYHLNSDEMLYLRMAQGANASDVLRYAFNEVHPPIYSLLMHFWLIISESPSFLRSLSLLFGLLLIPIYYAIGNSLGGRFAGLWCAFLITFGYGEIVESYIVRNYSIFMAGLACTFYCMLRWHKQQNFKALACYFFCGLLTCLCHFSGMFPIFCMGIAEGISLYRRKGIPYKRLILWLSANLGIACVILPIYRLWRPTMEYYAVGSSLAHPSFSPVRLSHALISPLATFSYLFPYSPSSTYTLTLYGVFVTCIVLAIRRGVPYTRLLLGLMLLALFINMAIHGLGLNAIRGVSASYAFTRHDLWVGPFVLVLAGIAFAGVTRSYVSGIKAGTGLIIGIFAVIGSFLFYGNSQSRLLDEEYMISNKAYAALEERLKALDPHSLIVVDRISGFMLIPESDNPYSHMNYGQWADGSVIKLFTYGQNRIAFDGVYARWMQKKEFLGMYSELKTTASFDRFDKLAFIEILQPAWRSIILSQLQKCPSLRKQLLTFPEEEVAILIIEKRILEQDVISANGIAHSCLDYRKQ